MLVVRKDSFAFVMRQYLINIGDDIEIFQVYAARNCLPVALPGTAADVFLEYELGVLVPEVLRLGPALLYAAVNNTVISDTRSAVRSVIQINDMALEIINRADSRLMPAMRGVSEAIGQREIAAPSAILRPIGCGGRAASLSMIQISHSRCRLVCRSLNTFGPIRK